MSEVPTVTLIPKWSGEAFRAMVQYEVIVEMWDKVKFGRVKRAFEAQFTEEERELIAKWQNRFRTWYLGAHDRSSYRDHGGCPQQIECSFPTLAVLQRAGVFFGAI